jgi:hypothetical protein
MLDEWILTIHENRKLQLNATRKHMLYSKIQYLYNPKFIIWQNSFLCHVVRQQEKSATWYADTAAKHDFN